MWLQEGIPIDNTVPPSAFEMQESARYNEAIAREHLVGECEMTDSVLRTKLHTPKPRRDSVCRERLLRRLDEGLTQSHTLTLISAPAGFGKTTLVSQWAHTHESDSKFAWVSLDETDNDLTRFLLYLATALHQVDRGIGQALRPRLARIQPAALEETLTELLNDVAGSSQSVVLVLDDYHLLELADIHRAMAFLLTHSPENLHFVIITRADPPLPVSRLRGLGLATEVRVADLRFTPEETSDFLDETMGLGLNDEDDLLLHTRTEGWAVGLQLAGLSLRRAAGDRQRAFIREFAGNDRYVADYLLDEVLQPENREVQEFLLKTSVLRRMSAPLCNALTGRSDGQTYLDRLEVANLFVAPLDSQRRWFRYHRLFADLLRGRLREMDPEVVSQMHRRACSWLEENDLFEEALYHAVEGQDFEKAMTLIEITGPRLLGEGALTTVKGWVGDLPRELVLGRSYLCVIMAWALELTGRWDETEAWLTRAEEALKAGDEPRCGLSDLRGQIAALRGYLARRQNDFSKSIEHLITADKTLAPGNQSIRTAVNLNLARAHLVQGQLSEASSSLQKARNLGLWSGNDLAGMAATGALGAVMVAQGKLNEAAHLGTRTIEDYLDSHEHPSPALCHVYGLLGRIDYEWNRVDAAIEKLSRAVTMTKEIGYGPHEAAVSLITASLEWACYARAAHGAPVELEDSVVAVLNSVPSGAGAVDLTARRIQLWIGQGNLAAAGRWAELSFAEGEGAGPIEVWPGYRDIAMARVLGAQGQYQAALDLLQRAREQAEAEGAVGWMIEMDVLVAVIQQSLGDGAAAPVAITRALSLAEPEGYIRTFIDGGPLVIELLKGPKAREAAPQYVDRLLEARLAWKGEGLDTEERAQVSAPIQSHEEKALIEPLTEREEEVLSLLAAGLTYHEIAEKLFVSINTIRHHTKGLYRKLDVNSRAQAVAEASRLGLL